MTRELDPIDVLDDLLGSADFPAEVLDPVAGYQAARGSEGKAMRLTQLYLAVWRLRLARCCLRAGKFFAALGERLYRL